MLERMDAFFERRLDTYDAHMLGEIEGAREFYPATAALLPRGGARILDLGAGTGLELSYYFDLAPHASAVAVDLSHAMLSALKKKLSDRSITCIEGSYFDSDLGTEIFDAAVSVESLHHFTAEEKTGLYKRLRASLKAGGFFVLTDYFAATEAESRALREALEKQKREENITDGGLYHFDTPLTVTAEIRALTDAGFSRVEEIASWGATHILRAWR